VRTNAARSALRCCQLPASIALALRDGDLPLPKPFTGAILAWKPPGIWRMSVNTNQMLLPVECPPRAA
jgi:hypothetical protein